MNDLKFKVEGYEFSILQSEFDRLLECQINEIVAFDAFVELVNYPVDITTFINQPRILIVNNLRNIYIKISSYNSDYINEGQNIRLNGQIVTRGIIFSF